MAEDPSVACSISCQAVRPSLEEQRDQQQHQQQQHVLRVVEVCSTLQELLPGRGVGETRFGSSLVLVEVVAIPVQVCVTPLGGE